MVIFAEMKTKITNLKLNKAITQPKLFNDIDKRESNIFFKIFRSSKRKLQVL